MRNVFAILAGAVFGAGLWMSGMTDTVKVIGWLDFFGNWNPTLAFVIGGAIIPMAVAWRVAARRTAPVLGGIFPPMPVQKLGRDLILGSVMFGVGWGLAGFCPGPAIASLTWGGWNGVVFVLALGVGMWARPVVRSRLDALLPPV